MLTANSFHVLVSNDEIITIYEIVPCEGYFTLNLDGRFLAKVTADERGKQVSVPKLPAKLLRAIYNGFSKPPGGLSCTHVSSDLKSGLYKHFRFEICEKNRSRIRIANPDQRSMVM